MLKPRTLTLFWLGLMLYAALQALLVARSGSAPFWGVFIYNLISENLRFASVIAMVLFARRIMSDWQMWRQVAVYVLWVALTSVILIGANLVVVWAWVKNAAFTSIWGNKHWIFLQNVLENALIIAGFVVAQYRREIKQREERERELRYLNTQMELAALRAQLNPHFLFNALNAVNALVGAHPEQARRVLEMLADLLRYTLESDKREFVPLREELDFVRKYCAIEQERFGKRLQTRIDADESLLDVAIPPMLLQPLVENAVKHGIAPKASGGEVSVRLSHDEALKRLVVEVRDNGVGFKNGVNTHSTGIGLSNVDARLQKLYGTESALHIKSTENGVTVRFSIAVTPRYDKHLVK
ncbi:MAG: histidine kinase [Candidatus Kapabacteria bacterium]|jgi:sensor histidine kinase YesM|nr:histidine kinase [Candidatus Kapabacteria bacterium]